MANPTFTLVATVRNEGIYLLEWIAYHRLLGFERFVFFSNDNTDGTGVILDALAAGGAVEHYDNSLAAVEAVDLAPAIRQNPQLRAYTRALDVTSVRSSNWVMFLDIDEFINIGPNSDISTFCAKFPTADSISFPWRAFGSSGFSNLSVDDLVTERFITCSETDFDGNGYVKTIVKPEAIAAIGGAHIQRVKPGKRRIYSDGAEFDGYFNFRAQMHSHGQVHHYAVKSPAEYVLRRNRGDVMFDPNRMEAEKKYNAAYFYRNDRNEVADPSLAAYGDQLRSGIAALRGMAGVAEAVDASKRAWRELSTAQAPQFKALSGFMADAADLEAAFGALAVEVSAFTNRHGAPNFLIHVEPPAEQSLIGADVVTSSFQYLMSVKPAAHVIVLSPINEYSACFVLDHAGVNRVTCLQGRQDRFDSVKATAYRQANRLELRKDSNVEYFGSLPDGSCEAVIMDVADRQILTDLFLIARKMRPGGRILVHQYAAFSGLAQKKMRGLAGVNMFLRKSGLAPDLCRVDYSISRVFLDLYGNNGVVLRRNSAPS